ncbi:MAG TPA: hypothetical protein VK095_16180 [Beutenbergiaceae bacterium]|nr:hypothetical protein [Beutenbergiaceae bacterium]
MRPTDHGVIGRLGALDPARGDPELGASAEDLTLRRIISTPREPGDQRLVPRRRRGPVAAASIAALALVGTGTAIWLAGDEPAYASWTPEPEAVSMTEELSSTQQCPGVAHDITSEGDDPGLAQIDLDPVLIDVRGDYTYQLSTDGSGAYAECFVTTDGDSYDVVANDTAGIGEQLSEPDEGITVLQAGTTSWSEGIDGSPGALTAAFGRVAPDVSHVLLRTAEEQVVSSVENGWWAAWAPGDEVFVEDVTVVDDDGQRHSFDLAEVTSGEDG